MMKIAAIAVCLVLAGCASPPSVNGPVAAHGSGPADAADPVSGWGKIVGSDDLDPWIRQSLSSSPALMAAARAVRVEASGGELARAGRRPEVTVQADLRGGRNRTMMTDGETVDVESTATRATAVWDLDLFGKVRATVGAARFSELAAGYRERDRRIAYSAQIADTYVLGRLLNDRLRIRAAAVAAHDAIVEYTEGRMKAGLVSKSELELARAAREASELKRIRARKGLHEVDALWRYLVHGESIPSLANVGSVVVSDPAKPASEQTLHAYAVNRPDVQAAHALWQAARRKSDAAKGGRLPAVAAVALAEGEGPSVIDEPESWTAWAGVRLSIPVLAPGITAGVKLEKERASLQEALFEEAVKVAVRDLAQVYTRRIHAEQEWRTAGKREIQLRESFASVKRQFEKGRIPVPELERARLMWLEADEQAITLYTEILRRQIDLVRACGGPGYDASGRDAAR